MEVKYLMNGAARITTKLIIVHSYLNISPYESG